MLHTVVNLLTDTSGPYFDLVRLVGVLAAVALVACTVTAVAEFRDRRTTRRLVVGQVLRVVDHDLTARANHNAAAFDRLGARAGR